MNKRILPPPDSIIVRFGDFVSMLPLLLDRMVVSKGLAEVIKSNLRGNDAK